MIPHFIKNGSDWISFHVETVPGNEIPSVIGMITDQGRKAGLVINPNTPVESVFPFLDALHFVLIMSVFPGKGGQSFITGSIDRVAQLKQEIIRRNLSCLIQVDGGINASNIGILKKAGADLFVIGTYLFNSDHIDETLSLIRTNL